ncbi:TlpA disulfide reductase family protein [uncultured Alistipes sp.]|uniref:TlpA disulfide reductase family protein n=1 Tax=uncultured Alistipes sp. TaxID=538949 RepID=UPI00266F8392|nr:TlpA disulfide reductase family protein [uncultured Alistipes sp.]
MKKILILAAAAACCMGCTSNRFVVRGDIRDFAGTLYLYDANGTKLDSAVTDNGRFRFEGVCEGPAIRYIGNDAPDGELFAQMFFLEPGTIRFEGDREAYATGTPANDARRAFAERGSELLERYHAPETTDAEREEIEREFEKMSKQELEENRDNIFGLALLAQMAPAMSSEELLAALDALPEQLKRNETATALRRFATEVKAAAPARPDTYFDIEQNTPEGKSVSLRSVVENPQNKYVLLDFWASWCKPCMREVPHLKEAYDAYRTKGFEIYAVSLDEEEARWTEAIASNGMSWIHVSDLGGFENGAAAVYGVRSIPSNYLIETATGRIVASDLRGAALGEELGRLLN